MMLLYLVGPPGVGKSTLMAALTARCDRQSEKKPFAHDWLYRETTPVAIEMGRRRDDFSGTDALSMSVQRAAETWIASQPHALVLAEGARLANRSFLYTARAAGYRVVLGELRAAPDVLAERRAARGSSQDPGWMRGASRRAQHLVAQMALDATIHRLDAHHGVEDLVAELRGLEPDLKDLTDDDA